MLMRVIVLMIDYCRGTETLHFGHTSRFGLHYKNLLTAVHAGCFINTMWEAEITALFINNR